MRLPRWMMVRLGAMGVVAAMAVGAGLWPGQRALGADAAEAAEAIAKVRPVQRAQARPVRLVQLRQIPEAQARQMLVERLRVVMAEAEGGPPRRVQIKIAQPILPPRVVDGPVPAPAPDAPPRAVPRTGAGPAEADAETDEDDAAAAAPKPPVDPKIVRLHMSDGTVVSGKLSITDLAVDTKFGRLMVPITEIRYVKPGLDSRPQLREQVGQWIEQLASEVEAERAAASAQLSKMGPGISAVLKEHLNDASSRRTLEVRKILDQIAEMEVEESEAPDTTLDLIATTQFTIAGKIVPQVFELSSDFGTLTLPLEALVKADRDTGEPQEQRKLVVVNENNFIHRSLKSTGLRVVKGDRIVLRANGNLTMSRWGNAVATPEGAANTGWYLNGKIYNGALVLRIGSSGTIMKAGSTLKLTAKESGVLQLGIAMNPRYATGNYRYPGEFKVEVKVMKK